jgi:hypothetical protein
MRSRHRSVAGVTRNLHDHLRALGCGRGCKNHEYCSNEKSARTQLHEECLPFAVDDKAGIMAAVTIQGKDIRGEKLVAGHFSGITRVILTL